MGHLIIEELRQMALWKLPAEQHNYYSQVAEDAIAVECVPMASVFTPEQLAIIKKARYKPKQHQCYKNSSELVAICSTNRIPNVYYCEGFVLSNNIVRIEHAFVKVGDKYIDPTFEKCLKVDVTGCTYATIMEIDNREMWDLQLESGYYGELYRYRYIKRTHPEWANKLRAK